MAGSFAMNIASLLNPPRDQQTFEEHGREYWRDWVDVYPYPCDEVMLPLQPLPTPSLTLHHYHSNVTD